MSQSTVNFIMGSDLKKNMSVDPFFSESNQKVLAKSADQLRTGETTSKSFEELERMADE